MSEQKHYTWEEKIESLVRLAKAVGRWANTDLGTEGYKATRERVFNAYAEFCEWRHEEPYVVDEIKELLAKRIDKDEPGHLQDALRYLGHSLEDHDRSNSLTEPKVIVGDEGITIISQLSPTITHNQFISIEALNEIMTKFFFRE